MMKCVAAGKTLAEMAESCDEKSVGKNSATYKAFIRRCTRKGSTAKECNAKWHSRKRAKGGK